LIKIKINFELIAFVNMILVKNELNFLTL